MEESKNRDPVFIMISVTTIMVIFCVGCTQRQVRDSTGLGMRVIRKQTEAETEGKRETKAECACDKKTTTRPTPSIIPPRHAFRRGEAQRETHFRADSTLRTSRRDHQRRQRWICL